MSIKPHSPLNLVASKLAQKGIQVDEDARLATYTTFRLGGPTPLLLTCTNNEQLIHTVRTLNDAAIDWILIGGGSNLLVSDRGPDAAVIRFVAPKPSIILQDQCLTVSAAASLDDVAAYCCKHGLSEFVKASGIPGTMGGAIVGNAGAFGWQVGDAIEHITVLEPDGETHVVQAKDLGFSYRHSALKKSKRIVVSATFMLDHEDSHVLLTKRKEILTLRAQKHPDLAIDSCAGSFFRNIEPTSKADRRQAAGWFLEQVGAKEMHVGGAAVFAKHANIPIKGDASCTATDIHQLTTRMADAVKERFDLTLIREVQLIGTF